MKGVLEYRSKQKFQKKEKTKIKQLGFQFQNFVGNKERDEDVLNQMI